MIIDDKIYLLINNYSNFLVRSLYTIFNYLEACLLKKSSLIFYSTIILRLALSSNLCISDLINFVCVF